MEDKISATPLAEQTGALPALHRGMQVLTGMPSAVYHAVIDDPHDADEEARANATSAALGGNVPSRVAMVYNRLFIDPQIQAGQKADLFQNLSDQARAAGNHETADRLQHAANVHREGSYAPMLGPWVADIVDRRFGLSSGTPDPYAYLEIAPAMAVPEATKELGGAALKTEAGQAAVRGAAKTADYVIQKGIPVATAAAGGKLGLLAGQALGLPGELGPTGLALYGTKQGFEFGQRLVSRIPEVPGTKFGLPPEPPAIDWSAFERTEPPSGPLPPPPPPGGGGGGPPPATPERLAAIRQEFEDIRARGQGAPATEAPAEAPAAAPTGDELAREYGYKNEQAAIDDVGRGAWQIAKAQGRAAGRPVGAPPPVAEPPAAAQPAPAAAPAPESALTQQLRASLAQEPEVAPQQPPEEYAPWGGQFAPGRAPTAPEIAGMRQSVDNLVEQKIPFDQFPTLNRRTSAQVGHALEQGDVAKAQQLFNDAVESTDPKATATMTEEQAQKAAETDQWTRIRAAQGDNKYFGKKMAVQQARVNASPELATSFRDAVAQFMKANAPQLSKP